MSQSTHSTITRSRRRWSAQEKAKLVRRHLRDGVSLADLAEQSGAAPGQISQWCKQALERLDTAFDRSAGRHERELERTVAAKQARISQLQEVVTELSTEVLSLKKSVGAR